MRAYLATTASLFGLFAALHVWRFAGERGFASRDPLQAVSILAIALAAAALSAWGWRLFRNRSRSAS